MEIIVAPERFNRAGEVNHRINAVDQFGESAAVGKRASDPIDGLIVRRATGEGFYLGTGLCQRS